MSRLTKTVLISLGFLLLSVILVLIFMSPIAKYLIEKYDEKYTGRKITIDWVYVNPFTGYMHLNNPKIYESGSDSVFFSSESIDINFALRKMLFKTFEITQLEFDKPNGTLIWDLKKLNIDDLINLIGGEKKDTIKSTWRYNIRDVLINQGTFYYREKDTPINYFIKDVVLSSKGIRWNEDTISVHFSFLPGTGTGDVKGDLQMNLKSKDYRLATTIHKFDLMIIEQYMKELSNYGSFRASLDADIRATGNFNDQENINIKGNIAINDFHFGKSPKEDYASFDRLSLNIINLSPKNHKYLFDTMAIKHPYFKYERYDYLDNIETMFGKGGENIAAVNGDPTRFNLILEIAKYVKVLARNFFSSNYKINHFALTDGKLLFNDYSISSKFAIALQPLNISADSIDKTHRKIDAKFTSGIEPYGNGWVSLSVNPRDTANFDMQYHFKEIPVSLFNPYTISYTSFPLDRGTIEFRGNWRVREGIIKSTNHLVIIDPRVTKRRRNKNEKWIPLPLIMSFIRERGYVIDYEIPITGNLRDPKYHFHDVVFDLIENIFVKPVTTPYRSEVKETENEIEKALTFKWEMRQSVPSKRQEGFVEKLVDFLKENPEATITVHREYYANKEKEQILFYESKKKFYLISNKLKEQLFTEKDSEMVDNMSVKDTDFVHFLNRNANDSMLFTIQDKCAKLIDSGFVNMKFEQLCKAREEGFNSFFREDELIKRMHLSKRDDVIPYNGFSYYKIEYNNGNPKSLIRAYEKMKEFNDEAPRKKFKQVRKANKNTL